MASNSLGSWNLEGSRYVDAHIGVHLQHTGGHRAHRSPRIGTHQLCMQKDTEGTCRGSFCTPCMHRVNLYPLPLGREGPPGKHVPPPPPDFRPYTTEHKTDSASVVV